MIFPQNDITWHAPFPNLKAWMHAKFQRIFFPVLFCGHQLPKNDTWSPNGVLSGPQLNHAAPDAVSSITEVLFLKVEPTSEH